MKFKRILISLNNPYFTTLFMIINFVLWNYIASNHERKFYNKRYNCALVVKVNFSSEYKGKPSIIINENADEYELPQSYGYDYNFKLINIGDRISKQSESFALIRIAKDNRVDTINYECDYLMARLYGFNNKPYQGEGVNCNCFKNDSMNKQSFMNK